MHSRIILAAVAVVFLSTSSAFAQSFEAGVHVSSASWSEFEGADTGIGGRLTFKPVSLIGIDAEVTWYPNEYASAVVPFSRRRTEGLFGATVGPRIGRVRPFAKAAAGFLNVTATSGAFACIAIFPPPLPCALAGGDTLPSFELGGGLELDAVSRLFIRGDIGWRFLKYPGPTLDGSEVHDEGFFGGAMRFTVGAGLRF